MHLNNFQGVGDVTPEIRRWIYLGTVFAPTAIPIISYGLILFGAFILIFIFVKSYQKFLFETDPTVEIMQLGRRSIRRGSSFLVHHQRMLLSHHHGRDYEILKGTEGNNENNNNDKLINNNTDVEKQ